MSSFLKESLLVKGLRLRGARSALGVVGMAGRPSWRCGTAGWDGVVRLSVPHRYVSGCSLLVAFIPSAVPQPGFPVIILLVDPRPSLRPVPGRPSSVTGFKVELSSKSGKPLGTSCI